MIRLLLPALCLLAAAARADDACAPGAVIFRGPDDGRHAWFSVEIADTPDERALGLMNRPEMLPSHGMLFVYDDEQAVSFWMENTLIPLDMLFIDARGVVATVHPMAQPMDRTPIPSDAAVQYVLEINGGLAAQLGIGAGSQMRWPGLDQSVAAWPCG